MTSSFRGVSARNFAEKVRRVSPRIFAECLREISRREKKKKICANLREISRSFLREGSRFRIFVRGENAKKEHFSWADLYVCNFAIFLFLLNTFSGCTC